MSSNKNKLTLASNEGREAKKVELRREMNLISGVSLIVGTMIGSGIFISPKGVFREAGSVGAGLLIWFGCGLLATFGALSYAEVGTMIPKSGGEYPILLEAFGPIPAYLFAWTSGAVLKPSSLALLSLTFSRYALAAVHPDDCLPDVAHKLTAAAVICIVVFVNCASVKMSTRFLTVFSFGKVLSLTIIIIGGMVVLGQGNTMHFQNAFEGTTTPGVREVALAFYQGLWAYDGWNQLNFVIEELKKPKKNLPRALVISMGLVTGLYLLTNIAYLSIMSRLELLASPAVAFGLLVSMKLVSMKISGITNTFGKRVLKGFAWIIPIAVSWSVFGTCLGSCFTAGRIYYVAAREGHFAKFLSMLHIERNTPCPAVLLNGFIALLMVIPNDFDTLLDYFSFSTWIFHGSTCAALLYFRYKLPDHPRPIKVPIFIPIIVLLASIWLVLGPIVIKPEIQYLYAIIFVLAGFVFYIPFVHFGYNSKVVETGTIFLQKLLFVTLPDSQINKKEKTSEKKI